MKFAHDIFRKCAIIDGLTHENPRMHKINAELIAHIPIDSSLRNLLHAEKRPQYDIAKKNKRSQGIHRIALDQHDKQLNQGNRPVLR